MEGILLDTMFDLPSLEGVEEVVISREVVEGTARPLYIYADRSDRTAEPAAPAPDLPAGPAPRNACVSGCRFVRFAGLLPAGLVLTGKTRLTSEPLGRHPPNSVANRTGVRKFVVSTDWAGFRTLLDAWPGAATLPPPCPAYRHCSRLRISGPDGGAQQQGPQANDQSKPRPPLNPGETRAYPVLPLRDIVVFPHMIVPLFVGREKSIKALEEVMRSDTFILLATQKNASDDDPATDSIYEIGTLASVLQLLKLPDGTVKVLVEGAQRAKVLKYTDRSDYYEADASRCVDDIGRARRGRGAWRARSSPSSKTM